MYLSPTGGGDGTVPSRPKRVSQVLDTPAVPGTTYWLLDGDYHETLRVPAGWGGTAAKPVWFRAMTEGKVTFNGDGVRTPVSLRGHDVFVSGIDACCSSGSVFYMTGNNVGAFRTVAWDASKYKNAKVYQMTYGGPFILEDTAGLGFGRKTYEPFSVYSGVRITRAYARNSGTHNLGPKMPYSLFYSSRGILYENIIGTYISEVRDPYTVMEDGAPFKRRGELCYGGGVPQPDGTCIRLNGQLDQVYGAMSNDALAGRIQPGRTRRAYAKVLSSIFYELASELPRPYPGRLGFVTGAASITLDHVSFVRATGTHAKREAGLFGNCKDSPKMEPCPGPPYDLIANEIAAKNGALSFTKQWTTTNIHPNATADQLWESICFRSVNGVRTNVPFFPWIMTDRIRKAWAKARPGSPPLEIEKDLEAAIGSPMPARCRALPAVTPPPATTDEIS